MKIFIIFALIMAALFSAGNHKIYHLCIETVLTKAVCADMVTTSTTTSTLTVTVFYTDTVSIDPATISSGTASPTPAFSYDPDPSSGLGSNLTSNELKSIHVKTVELISTVFSTQTDGVIATSLSTVTRLLNVTLTSTEVLEVTSTSTKNVGTTTGTTMITTSTITIPAASSISVEQSIAQMWGLSNGGDLVHPGPWLAISVVLLGAAHYIFFAHH
ncbi:hypothetical protein E4T38_09310 [Aureobasidium subglaciale]|nr:hypothetical protein E4T38_09310 [Aureobasidium subglaciale]KAI5214079.1 hypothetical protein E4T40_09261 [Aureobasidium subglaciale]KAI5216486.1 hypothetical protein E4T41_09262 [Aureobasidium subglaciale]KAI5254398.1 hypothetical protein E4T46_09217 [Aureobasidium subglaciale]